MKYKIYLLTLVVSISSCSEKITVVTSKKAPITEGIAAKELINDLSKKYAKTRFKIATEQPMRGKIIYLGSKESFPELQNKINESKLSSFDGYSLKNEGTTGVIYSNSSIGVLNGVYGLLNQLGYGLYMHKDALPVKQHTKFPFSKMNLTNEPVVEQRINFAWHNFLSGATGWDLPDWKGFIDQSQKTGFNTIMLHCYGNTPIFNFEYNGKSKWVGRVASTKEGREWRIQHCNDIRRTPGGSIFDKEYFGSEVTEVEGAAHQVAVQNLTKKVLNYANERGMKSVISIDVDTKPANSQDIITTLTENARIKIQIPAVEFLNQSGGDFYLANPDTPEGYGYYKAQVQSLAKMYPSINNICLWVRVQATPLMGLKKEDLPESWKKEYETLIAANPAAAKYWRSVGIFALSKVAQAYKKAAEEINPSLTISVGTWFKSFLPAADYFIAKDIPFIFLDYPFVKEVMVNKEESLKQLKEITSHRKVTPIYWGQEDNGYYYGSTLKPVDSLGSKSKEANVYGFGLIQWMQKSAEIFSANMNNQLWSNKIDESIESTVKEYVATHFNDNITLQMSDYFVKWVNEGTAIGRESGVRFITDRIEDREKTQALILGRKSILENALKAAKTKKEKDIIQYYLGMENFLYAAIDVEYHFFKAQDYLAANKMNEAKEEVKLCNIEKVLEDFAEFIRHNGTSKEELGLLASMNLRWYPSYVQLRTAVGMDDLRFNFGHTNYEPLVHEPGFATYFFDQDKKLWETMGSHEIGGDPYKAITVVKGYEGMPNTYNEIIQNGLTLKDTTHITIRANPHTGDFAFPLPSNYVSPGKYKLKLIVNSTNGDCAFKVNLTSNNVSIIAKKTKVNAQVVVQEPKAEQFTYKLMETKPLLSKTENISKSNTAQCLTYTVEISSRSNIGLDIIPTSGKPVISGLILERLNN